jgi:hypothetical protein
VRKIEKIKPGSKGFIADQHQWQQE